MKYYSTKQSSITQEKFVDLYNQIYYYANKDVEFERKIEEILFADRLAANDIVDIMRWKIGTKNYSSNEKWVMSRSGEINLNDVIETCEEKKPEMNDEIVRETLGKLVNCRGIGPTYALTLIYFMSKGKYPIYDQYAHRAVLAIQRGLKPNEIITGSELEKEFRTSSPARAVEDYFKYRDLIHEIFPDGSKFSYLKNREADRALWAYGHLFA